jgi:hypothetical protein
VAVLTAGLPTVWSAFRRLAVVLLATLTLGAAAPAEYQVKAVFLFNFTQFVDWPADTFANADEPFVIGVLGHDPFGSALDDVVRGETVDGRMLVIQRYESVADLKPCQILFIDRSARNEIHKTLEALANRRTLTVTDFEPGTARDTIIRFLSEDKKIRLRINVDSARDAGLTISSKLLRPSQVVGNKGTG